MGKYIVTYGQNLYDVSLHIYGSIEGIVDLMMNNTSLSLDETLRAGDELIYTDDYIINADIVSYNEKNQIIPSNGERNVYPKDFSYPKLMECYLDNKNISVELLVIGNGKVEVDWGDNSQVQAIDLSSQTSSIIHLFDNQIGTKRKIAIYGDDTIQITKMDLSKLNPSEIYFMRPLYIERFVINQNTISIGFIPLLKKGIFDIDFSSMTIDNLCPLLKCKGLMTLNLSDSNIKQSVIDEYLIKLVEEHYERRNCTVTLTAAPSGLYQEPIRDENSKYILTSGMEAVWVLTHEPSWNEGGYWKFIINNKVFTYEP